MPVSMADFRTSEKSWWCPGCGDFGVLAALQRALVNLQLDPANVVVVAGIGCSGKIGNYINSYNLHVTHGRTMPAAMGVKLANRDLTVVAAGGDGDGFAIGMGHFIHAMRRNIDITYIVMDNQNYGLTKGQTSPTSMLGYVSKSTPKGNVETPVRPLQLALVAGATFIAQGFSSNQQQLVKALEAAIKHKGFSFVNTMSPCVTYNKVNTYDWFRQNLVNLDEDKSFDPTDRNKAMAKLLETDELITGIVYQDPESTPMHERLPGFSETPIARQSLEVDPKYWNKLVSQFQ